MIEYHKTQTFDDDGNVIGEELILDENDQPIPRTTCICSAFEPNECVCGAWDDVDGAAWYRYEYGDNYYGDDDGDD